MPADKEKTDLNNPNQTSIMTKKMSYPELFDYVCGQLDKALVEDSNVGPRITALKQNVSDIIEVMKQTAGTAEDIQSHLFQIQVYQEPGLTAAREQTVTTMPKTMTNKYTNDLLAKVDELCKAIKEKDTRLDLPEDQPVQKSENGWPADMTVSGTTDVRKGPKDDLSWGTDPDKVRNFRV